LFTSLPVAQENNTYYMQNAIINRLDGTNRRCSGSTDFVFWASPFVGRTIQHNQDSEPGFRTTSPGIIIGFDAPLFSTVNLGGALGYTYTDFKWYEQRGDATIQSGYGGLYSEWENNSAYVLGSVIGAYNFYTTNRNIQFTDFDRHARGNHSGYEVAFDFRGGWIFNWETTYLSPFISLDYMFLHENAFKENGANSLDLKVKNKNSDLLSSEIGMEVSHCLEYYSFFLQASMVGESRFLGRQENATFACGCCSLKVHGLYPNRLLGAVALGVNIQRPFIDCISLFYQGKYGKRFQDHAIYLQIAY
jgi:outer membrane autotransporter protein